MDPVTIAAIISAVAQVAKSVAPLVEQGAGILNSQDEAKIKAALAELQQANEGLHARVQSKLRGT
jgi:hypothetical protein